MSSVQNYLVFEAQHDNHEDEGKDGDQDLSQDEDNGEQEDGDLDCGPRLNWRSVAISDKASSLPPLLSPSRWTLAHEHGCG
ncbi:hypothetical protein GALMADRAFT_146282 [Galerina marginata CBS 339.88]|uniref:Uncharacterized protein n=1 Tax=Galerina marginata (strain CBS 339.88) TaxID=685588 RepID=A0A067SCK8_GALM3|nr:hypothetical protein GALMADRAFT_146282 [Galerina marginata CBS 339.88]